MFRIDTTISKRVAKREIANSNLLDFRSEDAAKGTVGQMLELLVSPHLSNSDKDTLRSWYTKIDAMLALAVFVPDAI